MELAMNIVAFGVVIGLVAWILFRVFTSNDENHKVAKVERMLRNAQYNSIYDYDLMIAEIQAIQKKCGSMGYAHKMLALKIRGLVMERVRAERLGFPQATPKQRAEAEALLGVDDTVNLQALGRAHKRALEPYDPETLKKRNAPPKVLREATQRRAEIRRAYVLLRNCITK